MTVNEKIAVAVQRGVNDDGDQETDVTRTQHRQRQLVAIRWVAVVGAFLWPVSLFIGQPGSILERL